MPWRLARPVEPSAPGVEGAVGDGGGVAEARSVRCECCGMAEECTPSYIGRVRERFHGKWVCGLCAEAVKERLARGPDLLTVAAAVDAHAALCDRFNSTVRLNPKLSLASSMRDIARKSCLHRSTRTTATPSMPSPCGGDKIGRAAAATSCRAMPFV